jgi:type I restriction enzyme R subunit
MNEDKIEQNALEILEHLGYQVLFGPDIGPEGSCERKSHRDVILEDRLTAAVSRLNPGVPDAAIAEAVGKVRRSTGTTLLLDNKDFHSYLANGVEVEYRTESGEIKPDLVRLFDFDSPTENEFLAINQYTIIEGEHNRRPDIVLFVNGLPLVVIELKNAADAKADIKAAFNQIQTYKREIPSLFRFNELCIISDGLDARIGTISSNLERFMTWKTIDGEKEVGNVPMLEVLLRGVCDPKNVLDIVKNFVVFEKKDTDLDFIKKVASYHQYWAVNKAVQSTLSATEGDHRAGVVWHTQGSGKSLSMLFYSGKLIGSRELANPTVVVVTDRNDLDGQLFDTFANCKELLRQTPVQAETRQELRELLNREAGGVIFTTIQKFYPEGGMDVFPVLTDRKNVIVMADEAHRSQYGFTARIRENDGALVYGNAKYMRDALPNASYIGFTGTPIEFEDKSTPAVFGNYIDIYDIKQAVEDCATVPIYYESRLIDVGIDADAKEWIDKQVEVLLEGEDDGRRHELQAEWAQKEAIVGNSGRLDLVAKDIIDHFEKRQEVIDGKGMIVTMGRSIACDLYEKIIALRPDWHGDADDTGRIKVVITGSSADEEKIQKHVRGKKSMKALAARMKNPDSDLKLVIVCDMWLTGFDVPNMHTMYLDKPLKGHNLMQAIARVNRVYPGKTGGLVVDYLGVARALREALETYTNSSGRGEIVLDIAEAVSLMRTKFEIVEQMYHGFDYLRYFEADTGVQLQIILDAQEHILAQHDGLKRYKQSVLELSKAFALSMPHKSALELRDDVAFFQAVKARLEKMERTDGGLSDSDYRDAIRQIVDKAIAPVGVIDVFQAAGLQKPEFPILSDEFLAEIQNMQRKNVAVEALNKLLNDEIRGRFSKNAIKLAKFSDMLENALKSYKNGTIEAAKVIEMLVELAKDIRDEENSGKKLGLSIDEQAFYDALIINDSAVLALGDAKLIQLAQLLVQRVQNNISVDWQYREPAKARLRVEVKKLLNEFGYPPDAQAVATKLVLEQATLFADDWSK